MACQYNVPLSLDHNIAIDPALLGHWKIRPQEEDPLSEADDARRYIVARYSLNAGTLTVSTMNTERFDKT